MKKIFLVCTLICAAVISFAKTGASGQLTWTIANDTLKIRVTADTGTAPMLEFFSAAPWGVHQDLFSVVIIENRVTSIGRSAFEGLTELISVEIPNSVTTIGSFAFAGNANLTSVTIPNSVTTIGSHAFAGNANLTSVTIPNSVATIGWSAFQHTGLRNLVIEDGASVLQLERPSGALPHFHNSPMDTVYMGRNVTLTGGSPLGWLSGGTNVRYVTIGDSVTDIITNAFAGHANLTSVTIGNSVTTIEFQAFANNRNLVSVVFGNSVTTIGTGAFFATGLTCIEIPNSVTTIEPNAFNDNRNLVSVTLGNGLITIGSFAFAGNRSLVSVALGNSVTTIGTAAFFGTGLTTIEIPNSVTTIGTGAFSATDLTTIEIPNSVTTIGFQAFNNNANLTSVTIPNSVQSIGDMAFSATGLNSVTILHPIPIDINANVFQGVDMEICCLYVPEGSVDLYRVAEGWSGFSCIRAIGNQTNIVGELAGLPLEFYPNPVTNQLHITHNWQSDDVVELFDMSGRRVFLRHISSDELNSSNDTGRTQYTSTITVDMTRFQAGSYILKIGNRVAKIVKL